MQLKWGINIYIFACKKINMFIEWMSEDSIFIVSLEHHLLRSRRNRLPKTHSFCLFFMYVSFWEEEKGQILQLMPL